MPNLSPHHKIREKNKKTPNHAALLQLEHVSQYLSTIQFKACNMEFLEPQASKVVMNIVYSLTLSYLNELNSITWKTYVEI